MKKRNKQRTGFALMLVAGVLTLALLPAVIRGASDQKVVAISVLEKNSCVNGMKIEDLELYIDGKKIPIEGLLEVNRKDIVGKQGSVENLPNINRVHFLMFQMYDYLPELNDVLLNFLKKAVLPGDAVEIQSPAHNYTLNAGALNATPAKVAAEQMAGFLKKDITQGNAYYKSLVRDLRRFVQGIEGLNPMANDEQFGSDVSIFGLERLLTQYRETLEKLETLRLMDEQRLVNFAQRVKRIDGQKILYFVYQQEFRPELSQAMLNTLIANNQDNQHVLSELQDLFQVYRRDTRVDVEKIGRIFSDSGIKVYFIFLEKVPEKFGGIVMREQSEDVFRLFSALTGATGGEMVTGNRLMPLFDRILMTNDCYYLLFFTGPEAEEIGHFFRMNIKSVMPHLRVLHPAGFFN